MFQKINASNCTHINKSELYIVTSFSKIISASKTQKDGSCRPKHIKNKLHIIKSFLSASLYFSKRGAY